MKNDYSRQFRPILETAYNEAKKFNSGVIQSEHFVLGALRNQDGYAFKILKQLSGEPSFIHIISISSKVWCIKLSRHLGKYFSTFHTGTITDTLGIGYLSFLIFNNGIKPHSFT